MSWNYRVFKRRIPCPGGGADTMYSVREAFYEKDGAINGYSSTDALPGGATLEELRGDLIAMLAATNKPRLEYAKERKEKRKYGQRK